MILDKVILRIKRQDGAGYALVYRILKYLFTFNIPTIRFIHLPLYHLDVFLKLAVARFIHIFWSIPLFKARCHSVGRNLKLPNGIPLVIGSQLKIILGNNVTIGRSTIGSSKVFDHPLLTIGDNSTINYGTVISVAKEIVIGHDCMISGNCLIMDSDDHPLSPRMRLMKAPVAMQDVKPVRIGNNVWIGAYATILKGVTIGDNTVVGAHSVVTRDLPPNSVAVGIPARVAMTGIDKGDVE